MGTSFQVTLYAADSAQAVRAFDAAYRAAAGVDSAMSLYRPESEICRLNREASRGPVRVSQELYEVISTAQELCRVTQGAFDITVKPAMDAWGFYGPAPRPPGPAARDSLGALMGRRRLVLDPVGRSVRFDRPGVAIDLGGIAKGYALDRAAMALEAHGIRSALLNLGGNILAMDPPPGDSGWAVGIRDPRDPDSLAVVVHLARCAVASSGGYEKFIELDGVRYGHILDPRTAMPVRGSLGTSIVARTGILSDALSTALFVLGPRGFDGLSRTPGVLGLYLCGEGTDSNVTSKGAGILDPGR